MSIRYIAVLVLLLVAPVHAANGHKPVGHPTFVSPHANPIAISGAHVFVVNTPADTLDVIRIDNRSIVARVHVGVDPVSVAVRPDGREIWVSNHVSDSVSVIDNNPQSPTYLQIVATVQEFDRERRATSFDEPVGIAFAGNNKAYVALSSENQIAVVDVKSRQITKRLTIPAQDPRAIAVQGDRLYVLPFESNNQTQLSGGSGDEIDGKLVTFDAWNHSVQNNNVLSLGHVVDIVKHPDVPDLDLFVFDTVTDELVETVSSLGTLLYGLTVDSHGTVFVAQTDARNAVNGRAGTQKHDLSQLENRAFLNQITKVTFEKGKAVPAFIDLEPLPPERPKPGEAFATPFAIQVSRDDSTLIATAAGSDKLFTVDAATGNALGYVEVAAVPRGIALQYDEDDSLTNAWVLNAVDNTVSVVDLSDRENPTIASSVTLEDPTHPAVKRGRIAFETAAASSTGTFSCASCHPDGHTDQLLWVLKTPVVTGGDQIMPRSTMPVRGLRDTEPYHWDGIPGDPYGGNNSANIHGSDEPNSTDAKSSARHLIDGGLAATMSLVSDTTTNDEGKGGYLTAAQRDDMAAFLLSVPYPPAQRRPFTSEVTRRARDGFKLFHIDGDNDPTKARPNVCGDCHRMPHLVSTNTPGSGMDAPTWRGAYDRFLILPQGRLNIMEFDFFARVAERGTPERDVWQFSWAGRERFNPVWDMVLEMSTGYSGAFGRQVTLTRDTVARPISLELVEALESAALDGAIVLEAIGTLRDGDYKSVHLQFGDGGKYHDGENSVSFTRNELLAAVASGDLTVTLTGRHGQHCDVDHPQPSIWTVGPIERQRGHQKFPELRGANTEFVVSGRHVHEDANVFLNGHRVPGNVELQSRERIRIALDDRPAEGMHLLQLQNPDGMFSNDFILTAAKREEVVAAPKAEPKPRILAEVLKRSGWDRLIGTWVDEASNGEGLKHTWSWKIKDRVIESVSIDPARQTAALISVNAENKDVFQVGADSTGSSHLGTWTFEKGGDAVLQLGYTGGDGSQGQLTIRYRLLTDDSLRMTIQLPQPITVRLVRAKKD